MVLYILIFKPVCYRSFSLMAIMMKFRPPPLGSEYKQCGTSTFVEIRPVPPPPPVAYRRRANLDVERLWNWESMRLGIHGWMGRNGKSRKIGISKVFFFFFLFSFFLLFVALIIIEKNINSGNFVWSVEGLKLDVLRVTEDLQLKSGLVKKRHVLPVVLAAVQFLEFLPFRGRRTSSSRIEGCANN